MTSNESLAFWLALGVMLIGLVGAILPGIPGVLLIWLAALVYAIAESFATLGPLSLLLLTVLAVLGATADLWVSHSLGHVGGASGKALLAGTLLGLAGLLIGLLFAGIGAIPGALIGTISGILIVEYRQRRNWRGAARAGAGWLVGYLLSSMVEFGIGLAMVALFVWQAGGFP